MNFPRTLLKFVEERVDECVIEIYLSIIVSTVYANTDPNAASVTLQ